MKRLPSAFSDLQPKPVVVVHRPGSSVEKRIEVEAHLDAYRGIFPVSAPISSGDVVEFVDATGVPSRLVAADVRVYELVTPSHTDVFWEGAVPAGAGYDSLRLRDLHPEVVAASGELFGDSSYSAAVVEALLALEHRVSRQTGIDAVGSDLMAQALSGDPPPLPLAVQEGADGRAEQEGLRRLFMGVVAGIESPRRHEAVHGDSPERALEQLALASSLFHLLDHAYERQAG